MVCVLDLPVQRGHLSLWVHDFPAQNHLWVGILWRTSKSDDSPNLHGWPGVVPHDFILLRQGQCQRAVPRRAPIMSDHRLLDSYFGGEPEHSVLRVFW